MFESCVTYGFSISGGLSEAPCNIEQVTAKEEGEESEIGVKIWAELVSPATNPPWRFPPTLFQPESDSQS